MKPIYGREHYEVPKCSFCKSKVAEGNTCFNYCRTCGQAIDWEFGSTEFEEVTE